MTQAYVISHPDDLIKDRRYRIKTRSGELIKGTFRGMQTLYGNQQKRGPSARTLALRFFINDGESVVITWRAVTSCIELGGKR